MFSLVPVSDTTLLVRSFKRRLVLVCALSLAVPAMTTAETTVFRIGTGGSAGTYFPMGSLIAGALNQQFAITPTDPIGLVLAQRSTGSATNVDDIGAGLLESGLVQADVAHWAYHGTGPYESRGRVASLRAIATLYLESVHLVVSADSGISRVSDLADRRVSVDEVGSGTQLDVDAILQEHDLLRSDVNMVYLKPADAMDRLRQGQLDAFFIVAGYPIAAVADLAKEGIAEIIPIADARSVAVAEAHPFFTVDEIPEQTYANSSSLRTLAVAAQWVVDAGVPDETVYRITRALWSEDTLAALAQGHPKGKDVTLATALAGLSIPLHPGAVRFYREQELAIPPDTR